MRFTLPILCACALFLFAPLTQASLVFTFSPNSQSGTDVHIFGHGTVSENLGGVVNFYNLSGDVFNDSFDDTVYIVPNVELGVGVFIESIKLDHDADGDDFFFYFNRSVNAGFDFQIDELFTLDDLDFSTLYSGVFDDVTDPESDALGGFSLVVENTPMVCVNEPSVYFSLLGLFSLVLLRRKAK